MYFCAAGSAHRKGRLLKGWNETKGVIREIKKDYDGVNHHSYCELTVEAESGVKCYAKVNPMFNIFEVGEEVDLMEMKGVHRFRGNDRVDKRGRCELMAGIIPIGIIVIVAGIISIVL